MHKNLFKQAVQKVHRSKTACKRFKSYLSEPFRQGLVKLHCTL